MDHYIYLDHGATSFPKAPGVAGRVADFLTRDAGNPGRGGHRLSIAASRAIEGAREDIADFLGADPEFTLLGSGATFWLNTLLSSCLRKGLRVLLSRLEHNAVMRPLRELERERGIHVDFLNGAPNSGIPSPAEVRESVEENGSDFVILCHASNVSGGILPIEEIAREIAPIPLLVDGAQAAGSIPFDFSSSGAVAYVCSGHKGLLGPPGTGVLLLRKDFHVLPLVRGGTGSRSESEEMPEFLPDFLEAGTPNGACIAGLGTACNWLREEGVGTIAEREEFLRLRLLEALQNMKGVLLPGFDAEASFTGVLSFVLEGLDTGEVAHYLNRDYGIALRAGLHCAPLAHRTLGTFPTGTLRAGIGPFNTIEEIDHLITSLHRLRKEMGR